MTTDTVTVGGKAVEILRAGKGAPVLYLHGVWDLHTAQGEPFAFHKGLADRFELIAPAHPGCGESGGVKEITEIEDLAFHYLDLLDVLDIRQATVVGFCLGGWVAAEMAVRNPERIGRLALIDTAGLQQQDALIADLFMYSQHRDGGIMHELRELLFKDAEGELARRVVPDGRVGVADEVRRYKSLTLAGRVGWEPPYLHNKKLRNRLHRVRCPSLVVWGEHDRLIPLANGRAWASSLPNAALVTLANSGHSPHIEEPDACLAALTPFLESGAFPASAKVLAHSG